MSSKSPANELSAKTGAVVVRLGSIALTSEFSAGLTWLSLMVFSAFSLRPSATSSQGDNSGVRFFIGADPREISALASPSVVYADSKGSVIISFSVGWTNSWSNSLGVD